MEEKLEKQEDVTICKSCRHIYTKKQEESRADCPKCDEWEVLYGTKITTSKIYIKE